jgi:hypothetical protein
MAKSVGRRDGKLGRTAPPLIGAHQSVTVALLALGFIQSRASHPAFSLVGFGIAGK